MKYEITISDRAEKNLNHIFQYLNDNWPKSVRINFKEKLDNEVQHLQHNPYMYQASGIKKVFGVAS
ncbi:MAG: type II toxin-antitoxin system RelE/ParE family toxin [Chlorobi bacterium]|nr:type II toxin-antitoxin system RelE/ParE family toxin [Chlorobiota bacterium]